MCYSAQVWANYRKYVREFGAAISVEEFAILYFHDKGNSRPKTPKAMDDAFADSNAPAEQAIWRSIGEWNPAVEFHHHLTGLARLAEPLLADNSPLDH